MCTNVYIQEMEWRMRMSEDFVFIFGALYIQSFSVAIEKALTCFLVFTQGGSSQMYRNYQITRGEQSEAANPS